MCLVTVRVIKKFTLMPLRWKTRRQSLESGLLLVGIYGGGIASD